MRFRPFPKIAKVHSPAPAPKQSTSASEFTWTKACSESAKYVRCGTVRVTPSPSVRQLHRGKAADQPIGALEVQ